MGRDASEWLKSYAQTNADFAQSALKMVTPAINAWTTWYQSMWGAPMTDLYQAYTSALKSYSKMMKSPDCCEIPEKDCPPRCACTIQWVAAEGERRISTIRIRNSSSDAITYELKANPFETCGKRIDVVPSITPRSVNAAPGETVSVKVETAVDAQFHSGATYTSEILVIGKYERCVKLELQVTCVEESGCSFEHGDIPYRTRAEEWYHHFQCSEPCFEPVRSNQTNEK